MVNPARTCSGGVLCARGGTRTHKSLRTKDFKSFAYANSATRARLEASNLRPGRDLHPRITLLQSVALATWLPGHIRILIRVFYLILFFFFWIGWVGIEGRRVGRSLFSTLLKFLQFYQLLSSFFLRQTLSEVLVSF